MKKSSSSHPITKFLLVSCSLIGIASELSAEQAPKVVLPDFVETRTVELTQKVRVADVPSGSGELRLWVPVPSDRTWQRVLNISVDQAPGNWKIVSQPDGRGDFLYVEVKDPKPGAFEVAVSCVVERRGVSFPLVESGALPELQPALFQESLDLDAPLMMADSDIRKLAGDACGNESDIARQAVLLVRKVAELADHYSKDPSKPHCGRGSAQDCLVNGGGCCTDLHSLFIAMARSRGIASRMQYGYRLLDAKEGKEFDPGYRCWVEYFIPGAGWVPTDIVAADNAPEGHPHRWSSLSPYRVWLWEGRSFELAPKNASGPVHTMLCGWAEIDGKAVDPLPSIDGKPSGLSRTVRFTVLKHERPEGAPKLPE